MTSPCTALKRCTLIMAFLVFGVSGALIGCTTTRHEPLTASVGTPIHIDMRHPVHVGAQFYPQEALKLKQQGMCIVRITVEADGIVSNKTLLTSSNVPRLDQACMEAFDGDVRMLPATLDGRAVRADANIPIRWCLRNPDVPMPDGSPCSMTNPPYNSVIEKK